MTNAQNIQSNAGNSAVNQAASQDAQQQPQTSSYGEAMQKVQPPLKNKQV